jgi:hypothetical protein
MRPKIWLKKEKKMVKAEGINWTLKCAYYATNKRKTVIYTVDFKDCKLLKPTGLKCRDGHWVFEGDVLCFKADKQALKPGWKVAGSYGFHKENAGVVIREHGAFWIKACEGYLYNLHSELKYPGHKKWHKIGDKYQGAEYD